jgi:hypothetical protein
MPVSNFMKVAVAGALIAGASAASAQLRNRPPQPRAKAQPPAPVPAPAAAGAQQPQREYNLTRAERNALAPLIAAQNAITTAVDQGQPADWSQVEALLPAAQAAAQGTDARYLVARIQLALALERRNDALKATALDTLIASPLSSPEELPRYINARAEMAFAAQDFAGAERLYQRLLQLTPGDQRITNNLAVIRRRMVAAPGGLDALLQTIAAAETGGGRAEEALYRQARDTAYTQRDRRAAEFALRLARHYPTAANWRDAINVHREMADSAGAHTLDRLRLMRAVGALTTPNDYLAFAQALEQAGLPGETKAVLDEGISRGVIRAGDPAAVQMLATANRRIGEDRAGLPGQIRQARSAPAGRLARAAADALYGYGRYGEAAELYRAAMTKTGEDSNLLNLRLGAALAMAGDRAGAETALRAVTGGSSALAQIWLSWLASRPAR